MHSWVFFLPRLGVGEEGVGGWGNICWAHPLSSFSVTPPVRHTTLCAPNSPTLLRKKADSTLRAWGFKATVEYLGGSPWDCRDSSHL